MTRGLHAALTTVAVVIAAAFFEMVDSATLAAGHICTPHPSQS